MDDDSKDESYGEFGVVVGHVLPARGYVALEGDTAVPHGWCSLVNSSKEELWIHTHLFTVERGEYILSQKLAIL